MAEIRGPNDDQPDAKVTAAGATPIETPGLAQDVGSEEQVPTAARHTYEGGGVGRVFGPVDADAALHRDRNLAMSEFVDEIWQGWFGIVIEPPTPPATQPENDA